jgi:hypothetical protein
MAGSQAMGPTAQKAFSSRSIALAKIVFMGDFYEK